MPESLTLGQLFTVILTRDVLLHRLDIARASGRELTVDVAEGNAHRGLVAAQRISELYRELNIGIENAYMIVNRVRSDVPAALQKAIDEIDLPLLGTIPANDELMELELSGTPLVDLGDTSPVYQAIETMMSGIL